MKLQSIRFKLLILVGSAFLLSSVLIILMSNRELRAITDVSLEIIYSEKISDIQKTLELNYQRLQATLMVTAYEDDFKESVVSDLRHAHYGNPDQRVFPMIFDAAGTVVLHPREPLGSDTLAGSAIVRRILESGSSNFIDKDPLSGSRWILAGRFDPWKWTIAYAVPLDIKYASVNRFRHMLIFIMTVISIGVIGVIYLFLHRITRPISELASVSIEMARGNLDQQIEAETQDEVGVLAQNFITMRDAIRDKIAELECENAKRRAAQAATLESETKYRVLFENANDAIFVVQDMAVTFPNPRAMALFGYSAQELSHMPIAQLIHPEHRDLVMDAHIRRISGDPGVPSNYISKFVTKNGDELLVEISAVAIAWEGRAASLAFVRDITRQKKLEEQLQHAQKMEAIGVLAGGIAHDFNNILSGVLGYTERVAERIRKGDHDVLEDLDSVFQAGVRAKEVVKQILQFSRQADSAFQQVAIAPIAAEVAKLLKVSLPPSVEIRQTARIEDGGMVMADAGQLQQVLMNLCTNAAYALGKRGDYLEIDIDEETLENPLPCHGCQLMPGRYVVLTVRDNGPGIEQKLQERIFEPYFTTKPKDQGTGLGLAVSNGIVQNHRGAMSVDSRPGIETQFKVYLPAARVLARKTVPVEALIKGGNERVLLVDDETFFMELSSKILVDLGYDVTAVHDGAHALDILRNSAKPFDIMVTDQTMPKMTGLDLVQTMRNEEIGIPAIICTGFSETINEKTAADIGVALILFKPVTKRDLAGAIRDVLDALNQKEIHHGQCADRRR